VPRGDWLGFGGCIWNADSGTGKIYKMDQTGSIVSSFVSPSSSPEGIGFDADDSIWHVDSGTTKIYKMDQQGNYGLYAVVIA